MTDNYDSLTSDPTEDGLVVPLKNLINEAYAKDISKKKAKRQFVSNVLVVRNNADPTTEGKVYRFKYGIQIMEKILEKMADKNDADKGFIPGVNVFDYYKGANLIFKAKDSQYGPNPKGIGNGGGMYY